MNDLIGEVVFNTDQIKSGVHSVSKTLNKMYFNKDVVVISVVPGGMFFTADLVRQLNFDLSMDYISCIHTPGDRHNSSPIVYNNNIEIKNKHVILVDDAIESGGTMKRLVEFFQSNHSIASIAIATLFVKPNRVDIKIPQYYAYELETDEILIGYGLPWGDKYRNIPSVSKILIK